MSEQLEQRIAELERITSKQLEFIEELINQHELLRARVNAHDGMIGDLTEVIRDAITLQKQSAESFATAILRLEKK